MGGEQTRPSVPEGDALCEALLLGVGHAPLAAKLRHDLHVVHRIGKHRVLDLIAGDGSLEVGNLIAQRVGLLAQVDLLAAVVGRPRDGGMVRSRVVHDLDVAVLEARAWRAWVAWSAATS